MKKMAISCLMLLMGISSMQAQKMASDYFDEAMKYYEDEDYANALTAFKYIVDHYPKYEAYGDAFYNVGFIYYHTKKYNDAISVFKRMLVNTKIKEKERWGGDIMANPFSNYRHSACVLLQSCYYEKENYDSALYYFALADTAYPYVHFCGNEYADNSIYTALTYSKLYQKLGKPDAAIGKLMDAAFISGVADNAEVLKELKPLLAKKENVRADFDKALEAMYPKHMKSKGDKGYTQYYFMFYGTEVEVPGGWVYDDDEKFDKAKTISTIHDSEFYKMIMKL